MKKSFLNLVALSAIVGQISFANARTTIPSSCPDGIPARGYGLLSENGKFQPIDFKRHPVGDNDVLIEIMYSSICHSDIHTVLGHWGKKEYPLIPGHEMVGKITQVGKNVTKFKVGDYAGVGCMVNATKKCPGCDDEEEQYWSKVVFTYDSDDYVHNHEMTQGGYSDKIVVSENFAIKVPQNADLAKTPPLLCAGVTTYSPIRFSKVKKGDKIGIAGYGGLGHMGVQYAVNMGADVTVFDITEDKREDALRMGAKKYVNVNNPEDLKGLENSFDFILSTIPVYYEPEMYLKMLKKGGELAIVGMPPHDKMPSLKVSSLIFNGKKKVYGSLIGGIKETQEVMDYSVKNHIYPEIKMISVEDIDEAYKNVMDGKVKFRYVIDMKTMDK